MDKKTYQIIYEELKNRDSSLTEERFCLDYLDRSYHYTSMCKASNINISDSALLALYRNLNGLSITWKEIAESSSLSTSSRTWQKYLFFRKLSEVVLSDITAEAIH